MEIVCLNGAKVDAHIVDEWAGPMIVTLGNSYDSSVLPGFAAMEGDRVLGAILYRIQDDACEIAVVYSLLENRGIGTALIRRVIETAKKAGCGRVWLVTTNDNVHALRFYQKFGFRIKDVHIGSMAITRRLKPGLPETGIDGIPLAHEVEFELEI
ncbi:MAG TPA: GNAT family N-acetyltransferase [Clostridia bacterium]|nr:GNAT family N-acetyltransferase [Clostridia bacterium]